MTGARSGESLRILGVDPGSRVCGYGLVDIVGLADASGDRLADASGDRLADASGVTEAGCAGAIHYVECGVLTAPPRLRMEARLGEIARWLQDVITELAPSVLAVEDVFTRINPRSALALAQSRGAVLAVAGMAGLTVHSYPPAVIKKTVTGRGRAGKDQVARMIQALVGLRTTPRSDAADALAVAITHARHAAPSPLAAARSTAPAARAHARPAMRRGERPTRGRAGGNR